MPEDTLPTPRKNWADEDSDDDDPEELRRQLGSPAKVKSMADQDSEPKAPPTKPDAQEDAPVASLLSRIGGLSTDPAPTAPADPPTHTIPATRPKPNISNPLFGRALAGVKADRTSASAPAASTPAQSKEETKTPETKQQEPQQEPKMTAFPETSAPSVQKEDDRDFMESNSDGLVSNEFQVQVKLADLQADPNSPLYSAKSFEELPLHDDLKKGIYAVGFKKPSKIQEKALPLLLMNPPRNLIGQSQSGTGKTAAFTLNMLSRVDPALKTPQAICLAPSRELARQIQEVVEKIGQFTEIETHLAVPGNWKRGVKIDKQILIGTPGTVVDMLSRGGSIFDPKQIRILVLDEADEMIGLQGLGDQTKRIKRMLPRSIQNVLFSATFPDTVRDFADDIAPEANQIYLKKEDVTVDAIKQLWLECDGLEQKYNALSTLYDCMSIGQSIVFCQRKETADMIAERLTSEGHSVASLHGGKETINRDQVLDTFRNGRTKVLITTNVVARGIDIQQVNMVVNYDIPYLMEGGRVIDVDVETYIHRIGRTGRFGRKGCSVIFAHDEATRRDVEKIASALGGGRKMKKIDATSQTDLDDLEKALKAAMKGPD